LDPGGASFRGSSVFYYVSHHKFDPKCPDCRPAIIDPATNQILSPNHPMMIAMNSVWDSSSFEDQEAFHRVTVKNSRDPDDLDRMKKMFERVKLTAAS
jgi:hypothetical protein